MADDSLSLPYTGARHPASRTGIKTGTGRSRRFPVAYGAFVPLAAVAAMALGMQVLAPKVVDPTLHGGHDGMAMAANNVSSGSTRPGGITATTVSSETLAHVPGKAVTVQVVEFQPKAIAPEHHHAGSVTVYVLSGTIRSQLAGGPAITYTEGQSFFEPAGAVHVFAENPSATEKARIMAVHVADEGAELTTYH